MEQQQYEEYRKLTIPQIRREITRRGIIIGNVRIKADLINVLMRNDADAAIKAAAPEITIRRFGPEEFRTFIIDNENLILKYEEGTPLVIGHFTGYQVTPLPITDKGRIKELGLHWRDLTNEEMIEYNTFIAGTIARLEIPVPGPPAVPAVPGPPVPAVPVPAVPGPPVPAVPGPPVPAVPVPTVPGPPVPAVPVPVGLGPHEPLITHLGRQKLIPFGPADLQAFITEDKTLIVKRDDTGELVVIGRYFEPGGTVRPFLRDLTIRDEDELRTMGYKFRDPDFNERNRINRYLETIPKKVQTIPGKVPVREEVFDFKPRDKDYVYIPYDTYDQIYNKMTPELNPADVPTKLKGNIGRYYVGKDYIFKHVMSLSEKEIDVILTSIGFGYPLTVEMSIDQKIALLWYYHVASKWKGDHDAHNKASQMNDTQILNLLGPRYNGARDKASLMLALFTGQKTHVPYVETLPAYPNDVQLLPRHVWNIVERVYNIINSTDMITQPYHPYQYLSMQEKRSAIEPYAANLEPETAQEIFDLLGIIRRGTTKDAINYFLVHIRIYEAVLERPPGLQPPPVLMGMELMMAGRTLELYTDKEIFEAYELIYDPNTKFESPEQLGIVKKRFRENLVRAAVSYSKDGAIWSFRNKSCINDDTDNPIELERHGDLPKDDPADRILSYGVSRNYYCYSVSEITASIREDKDGMIQVFVPDWVAKENRTEGYPIGLVPVEQAFPVVSIVQLHKLMLELPEKDISEGGRSDNDRELIGKLTEFINEVGNTHGILKRFKIMYNNLTEEQQRLARDYIIWIFIFGMWLRFWKGPGFPFPHEWIEEGGGAETCEVKVRDENQATASTLRGNMLVILEKPENKRALDLIQNIPVIKYNWTSGDISMAKELREEGHLLKTIIEKQQLGDFCLAHASTIMLDTGYVLMRGMLGLDSIEAVNIAIKDYIKRVYGVAHTQDFSPFGLKVGTGHTDPFLGYELRFN